MRGGGGQQQSTASGTSNIEVTAAADSLTNAVVVSGPPETLKIIADVIKELDKNPEQERQIFVYPLKNATAENIMEILNSLFEQLPPWDNNAEKVCCGHLRSCQPHQSPRC